MEAPTVRLGHASLITTSYHDDTALHIPCADIEPGTRIVTKRVWRFCSNGLYYGITQYLDAFTQEEILALEDAVNDELEREKDARAAAILAGQTPPMSLNVTVANNRFKIFCGYRYTYNEKVGAKGGKRQKTRAERQIPELFDDVGPMPSWLRRIGERAAEVGAVQSKDFFDMGVVNMYTTTGASLSVHVDPKSLFKRPIVSARFFGDGVLSFGAKGQYAGQRIQTIPQPRGAITVMERYAADMVTHAVVVGDIKGKACSVMLRGCVQKAMDDAKLQKTVGGRGGGGYSCGG